ncbi:MAG: glycosyltransferase family 4 protein [Pseudolabrys sp.]
MTAIARADESQSTADFMIGLVHPFDIRGTKVGGLETYLRDFVTFCPENTRILFIGVDASGDLALGKIHQMSFRGRRFDYMPVLHYRDEQAREAARKVTDSITAQFFMGLLRYFPAIAAAFKARRCSIDLRRVEFAWLPVALRIPFVQMLHGEGVPRLAMDSLLQKYRFVHGIGERFAVARSRKFLCVNPHITERLRQTYPKHESKIDTLWTWVNTQIFQPQPFPGGKRPFRVVFAGRLDDFKNPPLMFKTMAALWERFSGEVEFHYVGTSDPTRFPEFSAIERITVRHGFKDAAGMAATLASADAGILTSEFEGMPRCVLETLAVGRPVIAVHLPQLEFAIKDGVSGYLIPREQSETEIITAMVKRFIDARDAIASGKMQPASIAKTIATFTPNNQLARVYRFHHDIQSGDVAMPGKMARSAAG